VYYGRFNYGIRKRGFPKNGCQRCIAHIVRNILKHVCYKDMKHVCDRFEGTYGCGLYGNIRHRRVFPSSTVLLRVLYLSILQITKMDPGLENWGSICGESSIICGCRMPE